MLPTKEQAYEFALMLHTGIPPVDAYTYFAPSEMHQEVLREMAGRWCRTKDVQDHLLSLQKGPWSRLRPEERIKLALDKHYNEMAYFLYHNNYAEISHPAQKSKADTCRMALEAKMAGMAGQMTHLARFWEDLLEGRIVLPTPSAPAKQAVSRES